MGLEGDLNSSWSGEWCSGWEDLGVGSREGVEGSTGDGSAGVSRGSTVSGVFWTC